MNPMKKKMMRIMLSLLLVTVLVSAFSMTAFAAGDVAGAIENSAATAKITKSRKLQSHRLAVALRFCG